MTRIDSENFIEYKLLTLGRYRGSVVMPAPAEEGLPHKPQPEAQKEEQPLILVYDTIISDGGITSKALSPVTKDSPSTV